MLPDEGVCLYTLSKSKVIVTGFALHNSFIENYDLIINSIAKKCKVTDFFSTVQNYVGTTVKHSDNIS